jgi:hypothetical protein
MPLKPKLVVKVATITFLVTVFGTGHRSCGSGGTRPQPMPGVRSSTHTEWFSSASFGYGWTEKLGTYYKAAGDHKRIMPESRLGFVFCIIERPQQ